MARGALNRLCTSPGGARGRIGLGEHDQQRGASQPGAVQFFKIAVSDQPGRCLMVSTVPGAIEKNLRNIARPAALRWHVVDDAGLAGR